MLKQPCTMLLTVALLIGVPTGAAAYLHDGTCPAPLWWKLGWVGNPLYRYPLIKNPPTVLRHSVPDFAGSADDPEAPGRWYFCRKPEGYYPRVLFCPGGWTTVAVPPPDEEGDYVPEYDQEEE